MTRTGGRGRDQAIEQQLPDLQNGGAGAIAKKGAHAGQDS